MWKYLKLHEAFIRAALDAHLPNEKLHELKAFHQRQIRNMQHERLIHLAVTLAVALFFMLSIGWSIIHFTFSGTALSLLFLLLVIAYIIHYFRLENGVQRWYHLSNRIDQQLGLISAQYDGSTYSETIELNTKISAPDR